MIKKINFSQNSFEKLLILSYSLLPLAFLIGNFVINFYLLIFSILFVTGLIIKKFKLQRKDRFILYLLLFFFISLIINLIFSNDFELTLPRVLKFILIIGFIMCFSQTINLLGNNKILTIYKFWSIIFGIVLLDIIFELTFKNNIFGFSSIIPGRIVSFTNDEMNIGHFFFAFSLIVLSFIYLKMKNFYILFLIALIFVAISFLIGERSNFLKTFIIILIFSFLIFQIKFRYKFLLFLFLTVTLVLTLNSNEKYKERYYVQFIKPISFKGLDLYLKDSIYGAHYKVAYEIFKDNPYFGVGIKNFRTESFSQKYENINHNQPERRGNTHPHQIHLEILSETGIVGYISFLIFILTSIIISLKNNLKNKNLFQLSSILYILINLLPLIPSGSFFSTYSSGLFWLNYAIMISYNNKN